MQTCNQEGKKKEKKKEFRVQLHAEHLQEHIRGCLWKQNNKPNHHTLGGLHKYSFCKCFHRLHRVHRIIRHFIGKLNERLSCYHFLNVGLRCTLFNIEDFPTSDVDKNTDPWSYQQQKILRGWSVIFMGWHIVKYKSQSKSQTFVFYLIIPTSHLKIEIYQ